MTEPAEILPEFTVTPELDDQSTAPEVADVIAGPAITAKALVLRLLIQAGQGGLTDTEGATLFRRTRPDAAPLTFARRRYELVREGLVHNTGEKRLGPNRHRAIVWKIIDPIAQTRP